jgi:hypothetical protein
MSHMLDCLVNYFGLNEDEEQIPTRYFSYHIVAGPGPTPKGGSASITTLAVHDVSERCDYCRNFHVVKTGGPVAAIAEAIRYLDAYHQGDRMGRVQSEIRGLVDGKPVEVIISPPPAPAHRLSADGPPAHDR